METPLEQVERHVREGAEQILRQGRLIETLKEQGHAEMLATAEDLLLQMQWLQAQHCEHLSALQSKSPSKEPTSN